MSHSMRVSTPDGLTLAAYSDGPADGPVVVAVHGYPDDHTVWDGVTADLAADHCVVTYDVRGAGASDAPAGRAGYHVDRLTDDLVAVLDAVAVDPASPGRPVHLLAHDWGAIATWHAVTDPRLHGRVASFTSISGPCLDHIGHWYRRRSLRALPAILRQSLASWYTAAFRVPVLPELAWRLRPFRARVARGQGIPVAAVRDAVNGLALYRENIAARVAAPQERRTGVPVQVLAPTADPFVTPALQRSAEPFAPDLRVREIPGRHWVVRHRPEVIARCVRELVAHTSGAAEAPSLRRARTGGGHWTGRIVVVTGAGSGIGRATALAFARRGAVVVAADRDGATAAATARLTHGHDYTVDVADEAAMAAFAGWVAAEHGVPDVVVNNAGIGMAGSFADTSVADWRAILDVNLWGVIHGCRLFGAQMREHGEGGHLVNLSSALAYVPSRSLPAYATTKAAVLHLSACLRAELQADGIGVTAVCPGVVDTGITARTRFVGLDADGETRSRTRTSALYARRNYTPERVAEAIVRAVERDVALAPVTAEAHAGLLAARLTPSVLRAAARIEIR